MRFVVEHKNKYLSVCAIDAKAVRSHYPESRIFKLNDQTSFVQAIRQLQKKKGA